jgi:hypothetical protein
MFSSDVILGRRIKYLMPIKPGHLRVGTRWAELLKQREGVRARRHLAGGQELNKHTRELAPLNGEDTISIQNQHGNTPLKWDQTGTISEVGDIDKYTIKIDGSGRLTNRNRRFLQPVRPNKEAIRMPAPADGLPAENDTALPPTQSQPRRSKRVPRRDQPATTGRRLVRQ